MKLIKKIMISALFVFSFNSYNVAANAECGDITIANMNWASANFMAEVDKVILEEGFGCNVELIPGNGGKLARSAGSSITLSGYDGEYAILKLSSGETRKVNSACIATIGVVSNADQKNIKIGKAGRNRWRGKRPQTRGVAMNPVDHPHGGGEGKTSGGRSPVSPWGQSAKGLKTRRPQRSDKLIITRRKKRKR